MFHYHANLTKTTTENTMENPTYIELCLKLRCTSSRSMDTNREDDPHGVYDCSDIVDYIAVENPFCIGEQLST